ncbi:triose-phosphate isomerase [uncultured Enterovirga sp.]|uniref:triose-phosphate isomerase n=1 Tax=uncultured Enterovirga sp. TaxID=2026352 RepID=UPI0035CA1AD5
MAGSSPRPLVAGNWKMNGLRSSLAVLRDIAERSSERGGDVEYLLCPPATLLAACADAARGTSLAVGGQDCHPDASGARTGDVSAEMLADAGATYCIVGHSERRADHGETDAAVKAKAAASHRAGLTAIVCVGETRAEREGGRALDVVAGQVRGSLPDDASAGNTVVAYEPVWAIGTGLVPTVTDVAEMHAMIRGELAGIVGTDAMRILYGGSVKPSNARELLSVANVNGALVGGASLVATDFMGIAGAYFAS